MINTSIFIYFINIFCLPGKASACICEFIKHDWSSFLLFYFKYLGKAIAFIDGHCECMQGWLEPLLEQIVKNPKTIAIPVTDDIDSETFKFVFGFLFLFFYFVLKIHLISNFFNWTTLNFKNFILQILVRCITFCNFIY